MCLYIKNTTRQKTASKDILVFKVVKAVIQDDIPKIISYYQGKEYNENITYTNDIRIFKHTPANEHGYTKYVTEGLHSYSLNIAHLVKTNFRTYDMLGEIILTKIVIGGNNPNADYYLSNNRDNIFIALFKIPVGSKYYKCDNCFVSDHIIYTGKHYTFNEWQTERCKFIKH